MTEGKLLLVNVPQKRWWKAPFKLLGFFLMTGVTAAVVVYAFVSWKYSAGLPDIPKVDEYRPPILTEVYTVDGVLAGEFYNERRKVVPYERIPKRLVQAFIASEDAAARGLAHGARVRVTSAYGTAVARIHIAPIHPGNVQMHWPEANALLPHDRIDPHGFVPDYNAHVELTALCDADASA